MNQFKWSGIAAALFFLIIACNDETISDNTDTNSDADLETNSDADSETGSEGDKWDARFDDFAEALEADLEKSDAYGVSAAIMEEGEVTFAAAFGFKDPEGLEPLTPDTLMQISSTTKQMTAVALLRKVDEGLVSLSDTLEEVMPPLEFALDGTWDDYLTPHHLLSHQGGLVDWVPQTGDPDDSELADYTFNTFDEEAYFMSPPGTFYNYSNPNFVLAGLLTETLDTRSWPDIMYEDIFLPLGMDRTYLRKQEVEADGDFTLSFGYSTIESDEMTHVSMADIQDSAWDRPAGGVWTTPTQMMKWSEFIMNGDPEILADTYRNEMTSGQVDIFPGTGLEYYGYGLFIEPGFMSEDGLFYKTPMLQHGGDSLSFTHIFYMLPEYDFAVSICANVRTGDFYHSLLTALTTIIDLPEPSESPNIPPDPSQFDNHVGVYNDPWLVGDMIITREGDGLLVEMPSVTAVGYDVQPELDPVLTNVFLLYIDGEPLDITFIPEEPGGVSKYIRNRTMVAVRVEETEEKAKQGAPPMNDIIRSSTRSRLVPSPIHFPLFLVTK